MGHNTYREEAHLLLRLLQEATYAVHAGVPKSPLYFLSEALRGNLFSRES